MVSEKSCIFALLKRINMELSRNIDKEYLEWIVMNTPIENPAIGMFICKEKNSVMARYALSQISSPIGISEYEVAKQQLPKELEDKLPSVEEIEQRLNNG